MVRVVVFMIWCVIGFCLLMAGCRAALTAEKLEASFEVQRFDQPLPPTIEVHYDQDRSGNGNAEEGDISPGP